MIVTAIGSYSKQAYYMAAPETKFSIGEEQKKLLKRLNTLALLCNTSGGHCVYESVIESACSEGDFGIMANHLPLVHP
jgi:hypothetical protein